MGGDCCRICHLGIFSDKGTYVPGRPPSGSGDSEVWIRLLVVFGEAVGLSMKLNMGVTILKGTR